jgi:predicted ABC-type ATPase
MKRVIIIAGPNGAGKTTFAKEFLPHEAGFLEFINADLIAAGLSPFNPEALALTAGKLMLKMIDDHTTASKNFAVETTLSGRNYVKLITRWHDLGYRVTLIFIELPSVTVAINRVAQRVIQGGHFIPDDVVYRRFHKGLSNFHQVYKPLVDEWMHFSNEGELQLIDWSEK